MDWYEAHGCDHAHCPNDCGEHPQPFQTPDGRLLCGRCSVIYGIEAEMVPCTPENCED